MMMGFRVSSVSIGSRNGLVPNGNKPFLEVMLTFTYDANLLLSLNGLMFDFWPAWKK